VVTHDDLRWADGIACSGDIAAGPGDALRKPQCYRVVDR
jgi:hypothetical protein